LINYQTNKLLNNNIQKKDILLRKKKRLSILYYINTDYIKVNKNKHKEFFSLIIYQGHKKPKNITSTDLIIPNSSFFEKKKSFFNIESKKVKVTDTVTSLKNMNFNIKNDINIFYHLYNSLKKKKNKN